MKQASPAAVLTRIVALINKLATEMPRNSEIAELHKLVEVLRAEQPRKRDWTAIKRRQRAPKPAVTADT